MNKKIFYFSSYYDAIDEVIRIINSRNPSLDERHIFVVPDKYTLDIETRLFEGNNGAFDAEVLTFARLFYRICDQKDYLSRDGAIMMIRSICESLELDCYKKSAHFSGFASKVYDTINSLLDNGVDILTAVSKKNAVSIKLSDIKKIYSEYLRRIESKFIDHSGRLKLLKEEACRSKYIKNSHFYFANFANFTDGESKVIDALSNEALSVTIAETECQSSAITVNSIEVYDCSGTISALKAAARRIRNEVINGKRYSDFCIATSQLAFSEAGRIFSEYDIPFYTDHAFDLAHHPLSAYITAIIELIEKKYRRQDMIELSKNVYCGIEKELSDKFENLANEFNIDYLGFLEEFSENKYAQLDQSRLAYNSKVKESKTEEVRAAEHVRKRIISKLSLLEGIYKNISTVDDFVEFISKIITDGSNNEPQYLLQSSFYAQDAAQKIEEILSLMKKILHGATYRKNFLRDVFLEGLSNGKIYTIPNLSDSVVIGQPSTFRGQRFKQIFVLGMNEGVIPAPPKTQGLFDLDESAIVGLKPISLQNENVVELDKLLQAAEEKIFISLDSTSEGGMSSYLKELIEKYRDKIVLNSFLDEQFRLEGQADDDTIADFCCTRAAATELLIGNISSFEGIGRIAEYNSSLYAALKDFDIDKFVGREHKTQNIACEGVFFSDSSVSVSRLQEYFACPYSHFIKYGLKVKPRKDGELQPVDIGTLLHAVVEEYVKDRGRWEDTQKACSEIIDEILQKNSSIKYKLIGDMYQRLTEEAYKICEILKSHFLKGKFSSLGQEITLSKNGSLTPLTLLAKGKRIELNGSVDYADVYGNKVRIIDYKTGYAKFSYADIFYGRKLQLPLYMKVFIENGYEPAAFFFFPFSYKWADEEKSHRFRGVFDKDIDVVLAMDESLRDGGTSNIISAKTVVRDGNIALYGKHLYALSAADLLELCAYSHAVAQIATNEIAEGYIAKSPYKSGDKCACDYCEYCVICGERYQNQRIQSSFATPLLKKEAKDEKI